MKKKRGMLIGISVLGILGGIQLMLYPLVSAAHQENVRSRIHAEYEEKAGGLEEDRWETMLAEAGEYNRRLYMREIAVLKPEENGYYDMLQGVDGDIMGYISIPAIDVQLPIYHGTTEEVLRQGVGHMAETSLPVGGINTHAVLSGHSGMAGEPMFSNLEMLAEGDLFYLEIGPEQLVYQIDRISVVLPTQIDEIQIIQGMDLVTLVTCTPFGVNTHRLLVRGQRVGISDKAAEAEGDRTAPSAEDVWKTMYLQSLRNTSIVLLALGGGFAAVNGLVRYRKREKERADEKK